MASADVYPNVNFPDCLGIHSERLMMSGNSIYVVSTFDQIDYFTAYTFSGDAIWEISFNSEIISSKMKDDLLFIFSRARNGMTYYLTCLDTLEGKVVWEKAILAPNFMSFSQ
jgi:hypothetical protein